MEVRKKYRWMTGIITEGKVGKIYCFVCYFILFKDWFDCIKNNRKNGYTPRSFFFINCGHSSILLKGSSHPQIISFIITRYRMIGQQNLCWRRRYWLGTPLPKHFRKWQICLSDQYNEACFLARALHRARFPLFFYLTFVLLPTYET